MPGVKVFKAPGATFESSAVYAVGRSGVAALVSKFLAGFKRGGFAPFVIYKVFYFPLDLIVKSCNLRR